jgi:hypothetical protein
MGSVCGKFDGCGGDTEWWQNFVKKKKTSGKSDKEDRQSNDMMTLNFRHRASYI